jgi:hypothetical protein
MGAFTNLLRIFSRSPKIKGKPTMVIPSFADLRDGNQTEKVKAQCFVCSQQLAKTLYRWARSFPQKSLVKVWEPETLSFITLDLEAFSHYLTEHFALYTDDASRWLADRVVADRILQACVAADSPLPAANWQLQTDGKRKASR